MIIFRVDIALAAFCLVVLGIEAQDQTSPNQSAIASWRASTGDAMEVGKLTPSVEEGRELYEVCSECHRSNGGGIPDGTMPQVAGQHSSVLIKQLMDIRSGLRRNPSMYPYVARLDDPQDLADLAAYIETLPIPEDNGEGSGRDLERGKRLYGENCLRCHGARGEGSALSFYPKLAGQHYRYLVRQIIDIAGGRRGNAHPEMVDAVVDFSARDVANVADYVSRMEKTVSVPVPVSE
jgi:cytochrome c553